MMEFEILINPFFAIGKISINEITFKNFNEVLTNTVGSSNI
jgi:hypothetical protein